MHGLRSLAFPKPWRIHQNLQRRTGFLSFYLLNGVVYFRDASNRYEEKACFKRVTPYSDKCKRE